MICIHHGANPRARAHTAPLLAMLAVCIVSARADASIGRGTIPYLAAETSRQSTQHFRGEKLPGGDHSFIGARLEGARRTWQNIRKGNFEMPGVSYMMHRLFLDRDCWSKTAFEPVFSAMAAMAGSQKGKLELPAVSEVVRRLFW